MLGSVAEHKRKTIALTIFRFQVKVNYLAPSGHLKNKGFTTYGVVLGFIAIFHDSDGIDQTIEEPPQRCLIETHRTLNIDC